MSGAGITGRKPENSIISCQSYKTKNNTLTILIVLIL